MHYFKWLPILANVKGSKFGEIKSCLNHSDKENHRPPLPFYATWTLTENQKPSKADFEHVKTNRGVSRFCQLLPGI